MVWSEKGNKITRTISSYSSNNNKNWYDVVIARERGVINNNRIARARRSDPSITAWHIVAN